MHLEYVLFISLPVPSNKLGSSSFHWSSVVMAKLTLFPPAFGAIRKTLMSKSPRPNFLTNSLRPRNATTLAPRCRVSYKTYICLTEESNSVIYNGYCRIKRSHVGSLRRLGQLSVVSKSHYKCQLSVRF